MSRKKFKDIDARELPVLPDSIDDWYKKPQEPTSRNRTTTSDWNASNPFSIGSDVKWKRDYSKCKICGGTGRTWKPKSRPGRYRSVPCECKLKNTEN